MISWVVTIPSHLKTQEMCNESVRIEPLSLVYVPDCFKTQEMCDKVARNRSCMLLFVPDHLWTQEISVPCQMYFNVSLTTLKHNLNFVLRLLRQILLFYGLFLTTLKHKKCVKEPLKTSLLLCSIFVTQEQIDLWCDDNKYCDDDDDDDDKDNFFKWYDGYIKRKAQKASIKEELKPIAWHPSRHWDWCMSKDHKKEAGKLWK